METPEQRRSRLRLAAFMAVAGAMHFLRPRFYDPLIPERLGSPRPWVYGSGAAELAAAALLVPDRSRRAGAWATAAVLVGVFPGNVKTALDGGLASAPGLLGTRAAAWL